MATRYRTIVADPPWNHSDGTGIVISVGMSHRPHPSGGYVTRPPYASMTLDEIKGLPVGDLAAEDAHLYLWTTNRYLRDVWDVAEAWGFRGVCVITWCKAYMGALGGGAWQSNTEFCLFARRGNLPTLGRARGRWYQWPRRRVKRGPTCSSVGCLAPRPKGARFCADCERAFEAQGEAA